MLRDQQQKFKQNKYHRSVTRGLSVSEPKSRLTQDSTFLNCQVQKVKQKQTNTKRQIVSTIAAITGK